MTFGPHLAPKEESISSLYGIYDSSLGNILTLSPPSPKRGKSLRMSLGIFTIHKKSPTYKKSALWLNLQSIWNGVPPRHTHGENRYSKSTGLIGLSWFSLLNINLGEHLSLSTFVIESIFIKVYLVKMWPNFVGSDPKSLTRYQKILWICSLGYENLFHLIHQEIP